MALLLDGKQKQNFSQKIKCLVQKLFRGSALCTEFVRRLFKTAGLKIPVFVMGNHRFRQMVWKLSTEILKFYSMTLFHWLTPPSTAQTTVTKLFSCIVHLVLCYYSKHLIHVMLSFGFTNFIYFSLYIFCTFDVTGSFQSKF